MSDEHGGSRVDHAIAAFLAHLDGEAARPALDQLTQAEREEVECAIQMIEDTRGVDPAPYLRLLSPAVPAAATRRPRRRRWLARPRLSAVAAAAALVILSVTLVFPADEEAVAMTPLTSKCDGADDKGIVVAGVWSEKERSRFALVLEAFEQEYGSRMTLAYEPEGHDIAETLRARVDGGCPPDIALVPQPGLVEELARAGQIVPIEGIAGNLVTKHYAPLWRDLATVDGALYGVWFKAAHKSTVWYDNEAFQEAGVAPPATWEQWKEVADAIATRSGRQPFAVAGGSPWTLTDWFENIYLRTAGPEAYDQLAKHQIPWTDDSVKKALSTLAEIFATKEWFPDGGESALTIEHRDSVRQVFGREPTAAMVFEGDFVANEIPRRARGRARFFPFPRIEGHPPTGVVAGGDVAVLFTRNVGGMRLLRFLATPQAAEPWAGQGGFISPNKSLDRAVYRGHATREAAKVLVDATDVRFDLSDLQKPDFGSGRGRGMGPALRDFLRDPSQVEATAQRLEADWQRAR